MTKLKFHVDEASIPPTDVADTVHVHLFGSRPARLGTGSIGNRLEKAATRLGAPIDPVAFDFLSIALAVVAADTFIDRESRSANGWSRELSLQIPVARPAVWQGVSGELEQALNFLSGDQWKLSFSTGGKAPPSKDSILRHFRTHIGIGATDCACLFSGGLDSMIGAQRLIEDGRKPLLISHSYRGDKSYQENVAPGLGKTLPRFEANANPVFSGPNKNDTSMRTRSLGFLAYGVIGASALSSVKAAQNDIKLYVPENGFIALNAPLTRRRIGSHSTRTTHPHFLAQVQAILDKVGLPVQLENKYRHMTKGEMLKGLNPGKDLTQTALSTVSCGKWKRKSQQCGHCVPCLIRRSAFAKAGIKDTTNYQYPDLGLAWDRPDIRDDVMAMLVATARDGSGLRQRAISSGPLPMESAEREGWFGVHKRGLEEVGTYLRSQGFGP
ncbi:MULTISPECIES: Qat anti-phage system QueC-like protein QatC [unclassified Mesorhizobium]|uniref:Qat anti-phage system QueC-like protein QatC n=1 Tax=unclassified Mesorhizobium TaxID=325217 RepID=UPI00333CDA01